MQIIRSLIVQVISGILVLGIAVGIVWYVWGTTTVVAFVDDKEVSGARVLLDDELVGVTPFQKRLGLGSHKITVLPPVNKNVKEERRDFYFMTVMRGFSHVARFESRPSKVKANVLCTVDGREVSGCEVEVDGQPMGKTPLVVTMEAGKHEVYVIPPENPVTTETEWVAERVIEGDTSVEAPFTRLRY